MGVWTLGCGCLDPRVWVSGPEGVGCLDPRVWGVWTRGCGVSGPEGVGVWGLTYGSKLKAHSCHWVLLLPSPPLPPPPPTGLQAA